MVSAASAPSSPKLDRAASDAVAGISPLAGVRRYLPRKRTLELGVEFRLR